MSAHRRTRASLVFWALLGLCAACSRQSDTVFTPLIVSFAEPSSSSSEGEEQSSIELVLNTPSPHPVHVSIELKDISASRRTDCRSTDYSIDQTDLIFAPGETKKILTIHHLDDEVHESDEYLDILLHSAGAVRVGAQSEHRHTIVDDDRTTLLHVVRDFGARGNGESDDTEALQNAIDRAELSERAVVLFPKGEYLVSQLQLAPGVTYVGEEAVIVQAPGREEDAKLLTLQHAGETDTARTLVTGLTLDGNRDAQGRFQDWEFQESALLFASAEPTDPGRILLTLENVTLQNSGGSGLVLGPNTSTRVCDLEGLEVFTDLLKLAGGNSQLELVDLRAQGTVGTTGIAITGRQPGFEDSRAVDVELTSLSLENGDLELDVQEEAHVVAREVSMASPPLFLRAVRSTIRISDSTLVMGVPEFRSNRLVAPGDVLISDSELILSERVDSEHELPEADRDLVFAAVTWDDVAYAYSEEEEDAFVEPLTDQSLVFENCQFLLADDVEESDRVFAAGAAQDSVDASQSLWIRQSTFDGRFDQIFSEDCGPCALE